MTCIPNSFTFEDANIQALDTDEKKELLLFQWLSRLEKDLANHPVANQKHLESLLLKYLSSLSPKPNQSTRRLIARCFNIIYSKGDHRTLFDSMAAIQNLFVSKKSASTDDMMVKLAGIYCLGAMTEAHGPKVMSLFAESVSIIQKFLRYAKDAEILLRSECLKALASLLKGAGKGASDALTKELYRIAKAGTSDKLPLIKRLSFELMDAIYNHTIYVPPLSLSDYESAVVSAAKYVDSGLKPLRNAAASTIATLLGKSQSPPPKQAFKKDEVPSENPILSVSEMLSLLCTCYLKSVGVESRVAVVEGFAMYFRKCGIEFAEHNYPDICKVCIDLAAHPKVSSSKNELYLAKEVATFLLRDIIGKILSETGQLNACRHLGRELKRANISEMELNCVMSELGSLLYELGPAAFPIQEDIVDPLVSLLSRNLQPFVKLTLATCLRDLCLALPQNITKIMNRLVVAIQRGISTMSIEKPESIDLIVGHGNILSAIIGIISSRPLFAAYEDAATIFGLATQLIKSHTSAKDYRVMSCQAQIGWTLIGSLMSLGPNFVKVHLSQLLLIWKTIFQKNQPKDSVMVRGEHEWSYLLNSKESALAALQSFISFNFKEISNVDVAKRIFVCLSNTLQFLATLNGAYGPVDEKPPTPSQIALYEKECDLRRRLFECFKLLSPCSLYESIFTPLMRATVDIFAMDPDKPDRFLATVGSRDGVFFAALGGKDAGALIIESVSPTSLASLGNIRVAEESGAEDKDILKKSINDHQFQALDNLVNKVPAKSFENDPHALYLTSHQTHIDSKNGSETIVSTLTMPASCVISLVDAAIELFALLFPHQNVQTQETIMEHLIKSATYGGGRISSNRKAACQINSLVSVIGALKYIAAKKGHLASSKVAVAIRDLTLGFVSSQDINLRSASCEIVGRISRINGNALFINPMIQDFVDRVVSNREPDNRAGSCLALGSIYHFVGGMAAGSHLKLCVGILHSLAADPHYHVHTWALHALFLTIESAGLMYGPFINSTLSLVVKLFMSDTHEPGSNSANLVGVEGNSEVYPAFGRILNALIGVIGPELQDSSKLRDTCFSLFDQLKNDSDPFVVVEAIRCIQNFILFSPKYVDIPVIIPFLQKQLIVDNKNQVSVVRAAAITCLYQLTQKNPESVLGSVVDNCLEEQLFGLLDSESDPAVRDEIKDILTALLRHVGPKSPSRWIDLCKNILSKSGAMEAKTSVITDAKAAGQDEDAGDEGDGAPVTAISPKQIAPTPKSLVVTLLPRWRTQVFALTCVKLLIELVSSADRPEDFNLAQAKAKRLDAPQDSDFLIFRIGDLIRLAFNSSTGSVSYLRLSGLNLLTGIIENYSAATDPDFVGHRLLEQYEAQIISALAPGFEIDATPDIADSACHVTAYFICSGIIQDISSNIRPVKLLSALLDQFIRKDYKSNGRTPNAQLVIKLAVLSAWASIYSNSDSRNKIALFGSSLSKLFSLWFGVLKEYCLLGDDAEQENLLELNGPTQAKSLYGTATKDITLMYYKKSWLIIMAAIGNLTEEKSPCIFDLFPDASNQSDYADLPNPFFTLIGLCVHELSFSTSGATRTSADVDRMLICIKSVQQLLHIHITGPQFLPEELINELLCVYDKLSQTEDVPIQKAVLDTLYHMVSTFGNTICSCESNIDTIVKILRIIFNFFANQIPQLSSNPSSSISIRVNSAPGTGNLLVKACDLLKLMMDTGFARKKVSSLILVFCEVVFSDARFAFDVTPRLLLAFKACLALSDSDLSLVLFESVLRGFIGNLERFSDDATAAGLAIVKNSSLALVLSLTIRPSAFSHSFCKQVAFCFFKLGSSGVVERMAIASQSSRALLLLSCRPVDDECNLIGTLYCRIMLPSILSNTIRLASLLVKNEVYAEVVEENLKTVLLVAVGQNKERSRYLNLTLLVNFYLEVYKALDHGLKSTARLISFIGNTFVQLASQNSSFKSVVQELKSSKKLMLETIMTQTIQSASLNNNFAAFANQSAVEEAPKIKLKMFG